MLKKTFKYRLYPTRAQAEALQAQLGEACRLYNAALQERMEAYRTHRKSVSYVEQAAQLTEIRATGDIGLPNCHCAQDVLRRLDKAFQAFFSRVKLGQKPGFPRFRSRHRYDSLTFPSYGDGNHLRDRHLEIQGVGAIQIKLHRPLRGRIKTVSVKRECDAWYVCFSVEHGIQPLPESAQAVGLDMGLDSFAMLSTGDRIANPRFGKQAERDLRIAQRRLARRPDKKSKRRRKAVLVLQKVYRRMSHRRNNFLHEEARKLINQFGTICVEELNVKGLAQGMLSKAVHDAAWSAFISKLAYKAEEAGRWLIKVDPRGTSQRCICGASVPKGLSDREHICIACGLSTSRDHASAMEILRLGMSLQDASTVKQAVLS